ncbi:MAG: PAS domain S-box protein [Desulfomonile tiedjei]|uniref:histidine kinase n=1 Tax=Desulfomonile tiedjei TaxID=2358 RepID=A0A9D6Z2S9_9BACT|nr:PAS domain S-box protein [Desulfomonile tiedjei]
MVTKDRVRPLARILIVKDGVTRGQNLAATIRDLGYEIVGVANSSEEALNKAEVCKPDLVIVDIMLKDRGLFNGSRQIESLLDLPVIFVESARIEDLNPNNLIKREWRIVGVPSELKELQSAIESSLGKGRPRARLEDSENAFRLAFENAADAILWADVETGLIVRCNRAAEILLEKPRDRIIGSHHLTLHSGEMWDYYRHGFKNHSTTDTPYQLEAELLTDSGKTVFVNIRASVTEIGGRRIMQGIFRDTTQRRINEEVIRWQRDISQALCSISDLKKALELCMDTALQVSGMDAAEFYLFNGDSGFELVAHVGFSGQFIRDVSKVALDPDATKTLATGQSVYCCGSSELFNSGDNSAIQNQGFQATAVIPVLHEGNLIGTLNLGSWKFDEVPIQTRYAIETIAAQVGSAIARIKAEQAFKESEDKYRLVVENAAEAILVVQNGLIKFVNRRCVEISGYSEQELLSMGLAELMHPDDLEMMTQLHLERMQGDNSPHNLTFRLVDRSGNLKWMESLSVMVSWCGGRAALGMVIDITDRKKAEEALRESEEKYRRILETIADGYYEVDPDGTLTLINDSLCEMLSYSREELQGMNFRRLVDTEAVERIYVAFNEVFKTARPNPAFMYKVYRKDGEQLDVSVSISLIRDRMGHRRGFRGIFRDVSDRKRAEERLVESLKEKDVLLREVHHRVKNNLAIVNSLLGIQARYARDDFHQEMFREAQDRIRAMAMAHEKLYRSENLDRVRIGQYVGVLVDHLVTAAGRIGNRIELNKDVGDLAFGLETAGPMGFILTELVSNCVKHAFPKGGGGRIDIRLRRIDGEVVELLVSDNGIGLPADISFSSPKSLGLNLVRIFARQLGAKLEIIRDRGTEIKLTFAARS